MQSFVQTVSRVLRGLFMGSSVVKFQSVTFEAQVSINAPNSATRAAQVRGDGRFVSGRAFGVKSAPNQRCINTLLLERSLI